MAYQIAPEELAVNAPGGVGLPVNDGLQRHRVRIEPSLACPFLRVEGRPEGDLQPLSEGLVGSDVAEYLCFELRRYGRGDPPVPEFGIERSRRRP